MAESRGLSIIRSNDGSILVRAVLFDAADAKIIAGATNVRVWHFIPTTGLLETYDFNNDTFTAGAVVTATLAMTYVKAENNTYDTGLWTVRLPTLTAYVVGDKYVVEVTNASLPRPVSMEFQYGDHEGDDGRDFLCRGPELAVAVAANTITLAAAAPGTLNYYNGCVVKIIGGTGEGQTRVIHHYTAARVCHVDPWTTALDGTSKYVILPKSDESFIVNSGMATGGAAGYILLALTAEAVIDSTYIGMMVTITGGTGVGQTRIIDSYDATGNGAGERYATVKRSWNTAPDNTSTYALFPWDSDSQVDLTWDENTNSHTNIGTAGRALTHGAIRTFEQGQAHAVGTEFKLNAAASATAGLYTGCLLVLLSGTGAGQARIINSYAATRIATVRAWTTAPDGAEYYVILAQDNLTEIDNVWDELASGHVAVGSMGSLQSGNYLLPPTAWTADTATSITLTGGSATNDAYNGCIVAIVAGTGAGQARIIQSYVGGTTIATVRTWDNHAFDGTTRWVVYPYGALDLVDLIWDELTTAHVITGSTANALTHGKLRGRLQGTAADATHFTLDGGAPATLDYYTGALLVITDGTGAGQARIIQGYSVGRQCTVRTWTTTPAATDYFVIIAQDNMTETDNIWDELMAGHVTLLTTGGNLDALGTAIDARAFNANLNALLGVPAGAVTDTVTGQVWQEIAVVHNSAGSMGEIMNSIAAAGFPSDASIADAVWDELLAAHILGGSSGSMLGALDLTTRANNPTLNALLGVPDFLGYTIAETIWFADASLYTTVDCAGLVLSACGLLISRRTFNDNLNALLGVPNLVGNNIAETIWDEVVNAASHNVADSAGRRLWTVDDRTEVGGTGDLAYILAQVTKIDQGACDSPADAGSVADKLDDLAALVSIIDRDILTSCNIEGNSLRIEVAVEQYGLILATPWDTCIAQIFDEGNAIIATIGAGAFGAITARGFFQYTLTPHPLSAGKTYQIQVAITDTAVPTMIQSTKLIKVTAV